MASDIIDFYKKALEKKKDVVEPQKEIIEEEVETTPIISTDDPLGGFLLKLTEKISETKIKTIVKEEVKEEALSTEPIQEAVIETVDKSEVKDEDPFSGLLKSIAETIEKGKQKKRQKLKNNTIDFINKLTEKPIEEEIKEKPEKEKEQAEELQNDQEDIEEQETTPVPETNNTYVKQLQTSDSKTESKIVSKIDKFSNVKNVIAEEVRKEVAKIKVEMSRLMGESGGGSVATQYAKGGTMDGDLNVTGKFLSGGVDLASLIGTGVVGGAGNKLVSGSQSVTLNSDGTIDFPNNKITPKDDNMLTVESSNDTLNAFSRITLTPYGLFAYDENSNSITIDSTDNDIILTTIDTHEWKFNDSGVLVGPGANGILAVSGLNSYGEILSAGRNILELMPAPIPGESAYEIWLRNGNTGSENEFLASIVGPTGADGSKGDKGDMGPDGQIGPSGESAYEIWRAQGNTGDESVFLASLIGSAGADGIDGINGVDGESAYDIWQAQGNTGTITDFLTSLIGPAGADGNDGNKGDTGDTGPAGQSAYDIWYAQGNTGTITDFLTSLRGEKGDTGGVVTNTDYLVEGSGNLFFTYTRAASVAPVQTVAGRTGDITLGISDIQDLTSTLNSKQPSGNYVELVNNLIPAIYLPGFVDDIQEYTNFDTLTATENVGSPGILYVTLDNNQVYRWGGSSFVEIAASPGSTDNVPEGVSNKYFTVQRAASAAPVQTVAGRTGNVTLQISDIENLTLQLSALSAQQPTGTGGSGTITSTFQVKGVEQGSYKEDDTIAIGTSIETVIKNMLQKRVLYVYQSPLLSVAYTPSITTTYEVGVSIPSFTITPTYTQRDGGTLTGYIYLSGNDVNIGTGGSRVINTFTMPAATVTLKVSAGYGLGPIRNDNLGDPSPTGRVQPGSLINTLNINHLYPYFYGKSSTKPTTASIATSIANNTATKVLADASGNISITYNANAEYVWFAHLSTLTEKTKWYITDLNSGSIGNGNFISAPATQNVTSPQSYWSNIPYKIYISDGQTSVTTLQYRNT